MNIADPGVVRFYDHAGVTQESGVDFGQYTDGMYQGNPATSYQCAQQNHWDWILDQLGVGPGFRFLDVGCGTGDLVKAAMDRGARAIGITIAKDQVRRCQARGLDVRLLNYRNLPKDWVGQFDGIAAKGSLEHFVQVEDAVAGRQNEIYNEMFSIWNRLLDHKSLSGRVVTTAIHFRGSHVDPRKVLRSPLCQIFSSTFRFSLLVHGYRGYYPILGQLETCAQSYFRLAHQEDGTQDYHWTSEEWCSRIKEGLRKSWSFRKGLLRSCLKHPWQFLMVMGSVIGPEAWPWQFRGGDQSPMILLRHVWQKI